MAIAASLFPGTQGVSSAAPALRIAVIGDMGHDNADEAAVARLVSSWAPAMVVTTGDNYYLAGAEPGTDRYDRTVGRHYCEFLRGAARGPHCTTGGTSTVNRFFPVLGNHDYSNAGLANYLAYFDLPGPAVSSLTPSRTERYYDVRNGPVHFFMLDSEGALQSPSDLAAQRTWLEGALAASTAPWKIVVFHHPPYSSSSVHGSNPQMAWPFASWGADLVLNGHDHTYERIERDGVTYIVDGLGGAPAYGFGPPVAGSVARYNSSFGAVRLTVDDTTLTTEFVTVGGTVVDRSTRTTRGGSVLESLAAPSALAVRAPTRILDTRIGLGAPAAAVLPGGSIDLLVAGVGAVPSEATAVVLNVTLGDATGPGFVQVLPTGRATIGESSTTNVESTGTARANLAIVPVGVGGRITFFTEGGGHLVADLLGWTTASGATAAGRLLAVAPTRVLDTRNGLGTPDRPPGVVPADGDVTLRLRGIAGLPTEGIAAVALNLTATDATPGYLQVLPGSSRTGIGAWSNLNVAPGTPTAANLVLVPIGTDGRISIHAESPAQVIVDVLGYVTDGAAPVRGAGRFVPTRPTRLVDSRAGGTALGAGGSLAIPVRLDRVEPPRRAASAVFLNITATETTASGFVQVLPTGEAAFGSSSTVNADRRGQTVANASISAVSAARSVSVYSETGTHVIVDVGGYFTAE